MEPSFQISSCHPLELFSSLNQDMVFWNFDGHFLSGQQPGAHSIKSSGSVSGDESKISMETGDDIALFVFSQIAGGRWNIIWTVDECFCYCVFLESHCDSSHLADGHIGGEHLFAPTFHDLGESWEIFGNYVSVGAQKPMVPPGWIDLGVHGGDCEMLLLQSALLLDVRISELTVVFPEADFDVVEADIEILVTLLELPTSDGEVSLEGAHDELAFFEVDSGVSGVDETTAM